MNLPLNIDITQILLHMLNFVILVGGLALILYKPVTKFLAARREEISRQVSENDRAAEECERLKAEYETKLRDADAAISQMRLEAEREIADRANSYITGAKEKADAIIKAAEEEAEARKAHILESAQTEIEELVLAATQKLLADTVTPERDSALYDEFIRNAKKSSGETPEGGKRPGSESK